MTLTRRSFMSTAVMPLFLKHVAAQTHYPERPIRVVAPFTAGAAADTLLRKLLEIVGKLKLVDQPMVVDNKPGAQAVIGSRIVANAPNDGYTLMMGGNSSHAANVHTMTDIGYDPLADFTPITQISLNPLLLVIRADLPVRTLQEFIQYAQKRPGVLNYATGNSGMLVAARLFTQQAGIAAQAVNYLGAAPATTDLVAGRIDFIMNDPVIALPFLRSGKLRVLGVTSKERLAIAPNIVPLAEQGLPDYAYASWSAMFGPAGLSADVVQVLHRAFTSAMADVSMRDFATSAGIIPYTSTRPEALRAYMRDQIELWGQWAREYGLAPTR